MTYRTRQARFAMVGAAVALMAACSLGEDGSPASGDGESSAPTSAVVATEQQPTATMDVDGAEASSSTGAVKGQSRFDVAAILGSDQLVLLNVLPAFEDRRDMPFPTGMFDHDLVFSPDGDWDETRDRVGFYRMHAWQARYVYSDDDLRMIIDYLDEHDIPLMLETEPLTYTEGLGCVHTESFSGIYDLEMAERIRTLGGTIDAIAIEEPYHFVHKLDGPGNCQWPVERVVDGVIEYVGWMRDLFPGVPVGTIEPIWSSPATTPEDMEIWLDTWQERSGEPFAFLHIDPDWYHPGWPEVAVGIEAVADARGVPFGVLYNGGVEPDGESWMQFLMENVARFENEYGGTPQHVSFQSWVDQPQRALPPDDLAALTSGITRYFGQRTQISVVPPTASDGGSELAIELTTLGGAPVRDGEVVVSSRSLTGALGTTTVTGTVPDGVTEAAIVVRINIEEAVPGQADLRLAAISFREVGGPELVINTEFDAGTNGWGVRGDPIGSVTVESSNGETWLAVSATPDQHVLMDSEWFAVTPGAEFELGATFGILDGVSGSVSVAVEFPGVARVHVPMTPPELELTRATTGADGVVRIPAADIEPGSYVIGVEYEGGLEYWPAAASTAVEIG